MDATWSGIFEMIGKAATALAAVGGTGWAWAKWRKREEHFPRTYFEVSVNFVGKHQGKVVAELVAVLENKGVVPLKINNFTFKLRGLKVSDSGEKGPAEVRNQLLFPHLLDEGVFLPPTWQYTFVHPGVRTEYTFVTAIPPDVEFVRVQGDFDYLEGRDNSHHAAKVLRVPQQIPPSA